MAPSITSTVTAVFRLEELQSFYALTPPKNKNLTLHFLLTHGHPEAEIVNHVVTLPPENIRQLTEPDPHHFNLTPLMIATMIGSVKVVIVLLSKPPIRSRIDEKDARGWSALHHAAVSSDRRSETIFTLLTRTNADPNARTLLDATPKDLQQLTRRNIPSKSVFHTSYETESGALTPLSCLSQEALKTHLGIEYRDTSFVPAQRLKDYWMLEPGPESVQGKWAFDTHERAPGPQLTIGRCKALQGKDPRALELRAAEKIEAETVIGPYTGELREIPVYNSFLSMCAPNLNEEYVFNDVDARTMGNLTRYINAGFPNAVVFPTNKKGLPQIYLVAIEDIPKGEALLFNYGITYLEGFYAPQILMGKEKMRVFFAHGLAPVLTRLEQEKRNKSFLSQLIYCQLVFPLNTPLALFDLHFSGLVSVNQWMRTVYHLNDQIITTRAELEASQRFPIKWEQKMTLQGTYVYSLLRRIQEFERKVADNPSLREQASNWVLSSIGELSVMQIVKGLQAIGDQSTTKILDTKVLNSYLERYDWKKDKNGPLSFEANKRDLLAYAKGMSPFIAKMVVACEVEDLQKRKAPQHESLQKWRWVFEQL